MSLNLEILEKNSSSTVVENVFPKNCILLCSATYSYTVECNRNLLITTTTIKTIKRISIGPRSPASDPHSSRSKSMNLKSLSMIESLSIKFNYDDWPHNEVSISSKKPAEFIIDKLGDFL